MNQALLLICFLGFSSAVVIRNQVDASLTQACFHCLCVVESGCKPIGCQPNQYRTTGCGYYLLTLSHYVDCGKIGYQEGEDVTTAWKRCSADYGCSTQCVRNYYMYTGRNCGNQMTPCEMMVRNHEGGNYGCTLNGTLGIWNSVQSCCGTDQC